MRVGIFETNHYEGAYPVIKLFDIPSNELVIFTNPATYKRFADLFKDDSNRFEWVVLDDSSYGWGFFRRLYHEIGNRRLNLLYVNTIPHHHLFFAWVFARLRIPRMVLTLHDINCMYETAFSLRPRKLAHYLGKKWLTRQLQEFNVVSDTMINYLHTKTGGKKKIHNIPGAVFEYRHQPVAIQAYLHLVIPGSLDKKRRNYAAVFELLQLAETKKVPLHITLLGGYTDAWGRHIVQQAAAFKTSYTRIGYYDTDVVDQDEFDRQLDSAHFIFIPSVIHTAICFDIPETYGITKSSGNIFDVIKHAKPFIVPTELQIPAALESSCRRYDSITSLLNYSSMLLQQPTLYAGLQQNAVDNSTTYTIEALREKNVGLIKGS